MVYPVGTPFQSQQIPAANTFQPGGTEATKRPEENRTPDNTRPAGTDTARSQSSETRNLGRVPESRDYDSAQVAERSSDNGSVSVSSSRGSNLNITV
ncbi:MAG: hypothetical protein DI551_06710 [Micavibrio aeruginosavorus]|uniref:Uncharacterized protein n=1 Tax=Micavibrio aeruginosavorus TaxID=349221 RepID=A0A2W5N4L8_9BACT|nr:MAG: hypothetical protein DI551_06710 [Micavibrio aeruginosavorus]